MTTWLDCSQRCIAAAHAQVALQLAERKPVSLLWSDPAGSSLLIGTTGGSLRRWDIATGRQTLLLEHHSPRDHMLVSPSGALGLLCNRGLSAWLWRLRDMRRVRVFTAARGGIQCAALSPSDTLVACGSTDGSLLVWPTGAEGRHRHWQAHRGPVAVLAWLDARRLISAGQDGLLCMWDGAAGMALRRYQMTDPGVWLACAPGGAEVVVADAGGVIMRWEPASGDRLGALSLSGHGTNSALSYQDVGGDRVLVGMSDGRLLRWESAMRRVSTLCTLDQALTTILPVRGGRLLAAGGGAGCIYWLKRSEEGAIV